MAKRNEQYVLLLNGLEKFQSFLNSDSAQAEKEIKDYLDTFNRSTASLLFARLTMGSDTEDNPFKKACYHLFDALSLDRYQKPLYFNPQTTLYDTLKYLHNHVGVEQKKKLKVLIALIGKKITYSKLKLLLLGLVVISLVVTIAFIPVIQDFLTTAIDLTIIGLVYTSSISLIKLRDTYYEPNSLDAAKRRDTLFLILNSALNILGYSLWIASAALMTPLIAGLFIAASVIDVVREIVLAWKNYKQQKKALDSINTESPAMELKCAKNIKVARIGFESKRHQTVAFINLSAAIVLCGLITAWCFLPTSALVTLSLVAAMLLINGIKQMIHKCSHARHAAQRTIGLFAIYDKFKETLGKSVRLETPVEPETPPTLFARVPTGDASDMPVLKLPPGAAETKSPESPIIFSSGSSSSPTFFQLGADPTRSLLAAFSAPATPEQAPRDKASSPSLSFFPTTAIPPGLSLRGHDFDDVVCSETIPSPVFGSSDTSRK